MIKDILKPEMTQNFPDDIKLCHGAGDVHLPQIFRADQRHKFSGLIWPGFAGILWMTSRLAYQQESCLPSRPFSHSLGFDQVDERIIGLMVTDFPLAEHLTPGGHLYPIESIQEQI